MRFFIKFLFIAGFCAGAGPLLIGADYLRPSVPSGIAHSSYEALLQKYVNVLGLVDYGAWKTNREDLQKLDEYLSQFGQKPDPQISIGEEAASLINAYNAFTIQSMLENYPVESILQVKDVWTSRRHLMGGLRVSLDDIEKGALIPLIGWKVHTVVVCAARSCPPLQNFAYTPGNLDGQIETAYRIWLSRIDLNRFSSTQKIAEISQIFEWYSEDFETGGGIKSILQRYAPERHKPFLASEKFKITYLDYHWGLNDQGGQGKNYTGSLLDIILN